MHPLFGALLGRWLQGVWDAWAGPCRSVFEWGPGNGLLACDILHHVRKHTPDLRAALAYRLVERSAAQMARQRLALAGSRWSANVWAG